MSFAPGPFRPLGRQGGGAHFRGLQSPPKGSRGQVGTLVYRSPGSTARVAFVGVSRSSAGVALGGCTMTLLRRTPEGIVLPVMTTVSDATGTYRFDDPGTGPFQIRLTKAGTPFVAGLSADTLQPAARIAASLADPSFTTLFSGADENPVSELGRWGRNQANAWTNMRVVSGNLVGTQVGNAYDDSYTEAQADFGADYEIDTVVFRHASISAANHEIELEFRFIDDADSVRGYEVLLNKDGTIQCFRWNDSFSLFTEIAAVGSTAMGTVADGALFKGRIVGDIITVYFGGVQQCTFDIGSIPGAKYTTGQPGLGAFCRPALDGSNSLHFGFQSATVTRL